MKISVVTVCYNSARTIRGTIDSFLRQRYEDKELLVIDNLSDDGTAAIARSYQSGLIRVISEKDAGIYDAMNKGLRWFSGDAVGFLNSDDMFHSDRALLSIAEGLAGAEIVFGNLHMVADHQTKRIVRTWEPGEYTRAAFRLGWVPPHPTFYVRRRVVETVGQLDLKYQIASDYDYMLRALAIHNFSSRYIPDVLVDYQMGGTSSGSLRNIIKTSFECLDSRRRHLGSYPIDAAFFIRPLRRLLQVNWFPRNSKIEPG